MTDKPMTLNEWRMAAMYAFRGDQRALIEAVEQGRFPPPPQPVTPAPARMSRKERDASGAFDT